MCTGNTKFHLLLEPEQPVYPCVYREHYGVNVVLDRVSRFIPVYTGNTNWLSDRNTVLPVYPCVYREHIRKSIPVPY